MKDKHINELIYLYHQGNEWAYEELFCHAKRMIFKMVNFLLTQSHNEWLEKSECVQIGLVTFQKSLDYYSESKEAAFSTYFYTMLKYSILNYRTQIMKQRQKETTFDYLRDFEEYDLLNHYQDFDFIWASPPCQSHSRIRYCFGFRGKRIRFAPLYPDLMLWQEIIFLKHYARCDWVVENVIPYYQPLIAPTFQLQRHYFWSNRIVPKANFAPDNIRKANIAQHQNRIGIDLSPYQIRNKAQILRNCVAPEVGKYIFDNFFNN